MPNRGPILARSPFAFGALALLVAAGPSEAADEDSNEEVTHAAGDDALQTRVEARPARRARPEERRRLDDAARLTATPEDALEGLGGVGLARGGGPLAPVRLYLRGLTGPRVRADVGGLSLVDPGTGDLDPALWPLFAAAAVVRAPGAGDGGLGGRLSLAPLEAYTPTVRAQLGAGTLDTLRGELLVGAPSGDGGHVTLALHAASTRGDFVFVPSTPSGTAFSPGVRRNNDQRRASTLLNARSFIGPTTVEVTAFGAAHEGGIPGFATAPTEGLRGERLQAGAGARVAVDLGDMNASARAQATYASRQVRSPSRGTEEGVSSIQASVDAALALPPLSLDGLDVSAAIEAGGARSSVFELPFARTSARLAARGDLSLLNGALWLAAALGAKGHSDVGLIPEGHLTAELGARRGFGVGVSVSHGGRAPTLDELYAPRGLVLGNPALLPERSTDVEVYLRLPRAALLEGRLAAFAGRLEETILFLHQNAFELRPVNTGPAWRAGLEGRLALRPVPVFGIEAAATALSSRIDTTSAPLPTAPPLLGRLSLRLGPENGPQLVTLLRHRAPAAGSLFGTLVVPGYALWDLVVRWPVGERLALSAAFTNLFDVQDAQDVNLFPLPGRQLFCSLELRHD